MKICILSSYFSKKNHPNSPHDKHVVGRKSNGKIENNSYEYLKVWKASIETNNLTGIIFHDDLSDEFVKNNSSDNIKFIKVKDSSYSNNDYRFFCFRDFLTNNEFDIVFHADLSDVKVVSSPEKLLRDFNNVDFFACQDSIMLNQFPYADGHQQFQWEDYVYILLNQSSLPLINMGVVGGNYNNMLDFYSKFCKIREDCNVDANINMWICQYLLRIIYKNKKILVGDPVCSEYKKFQENRKDVYFIHK